MDRRTLRRGPEDSLVRAHTPSYLRQVWADAHWRLFRVVLPTPIVASPARLVDADQASLELTTPGAVTVSLRVRWSRFLKIRGIGVGGDRAELEPDGYGWTTLVSTRAGHYRITG
jgi:hypothetical protein